MPSIDVVTVRTPNKFYNEMRNRAILPETLMCGTQAMREAGKEFLPQELMESPDAYKIRLARSFLYNAYGRAVNDLVGRLFKEGVICDKMPQELMDLCEDIDLTGRDLARFARDIFKDAFHPGIAFILVDFPPAPKESPDQPKRVMSVAEEKASGRRPYWIHIPQSSVINWSTDVINGVETLTRVQILETIVVPDGPWGSAEIEQVKVLYPGSWEIWRMVPGAKEWACIDKGLTTLDFIPLVPIYTNRTGLMTGRPLLENLAELNLCHWQSSSDQRHILHVARVPLLFGAGFTDVGKVEIGPNRLIKNSDPNAKLTYVEHTGKAIEAGTTDLEKLEDQMKVCAMEPLVPKTGGQTATAKAIDSAEAASLLEEIGECLSDSLELAMSYTLAWMGKKDGETGCIEFPADLNASMASQADLDALNKARINGDISRQTYVAELKNRKVLSREFDAEADAELLDQEGPALGDMTPDLTKKPMKDPMQMEE